MVPTVEEAPPTPSNLAFVRVLRDIRATTWPKAPHRFAAGYLCNDSRQIT